MPTPIIIIDPTIILMDFTIMVDIIVMDITIMGIEDLDMDTTITMVTDTITEDVIVRLMDNMDIIGIGLIINVPITIDRM